jgi:hypothetical protein
LKDLYAQIKEGWLTSDKKTGELQVGWKSASLSKFLRKRVVNCLDTALTMIFTSIPNRQKRTCSSPQGNWWKSCQKDQKEPLSRYLAHLKRASSMTASLRELFL